MRQMTGIFLNRFSADDFTGWVGSVTDDGEHDGEDPASSSYTSPCSAS